MTTTFTEAETDLQQLTQEIARVTGIIRVNYPDLYTSLCDSHPVIAYMEHKLDEEQFEYYLAFLTGQLSAHRSAYGNN